MAEIIHTNGHKDPYRVTVCFDRKSWWWAPTNEEIFRLLALWFEAEDYGFEDGWGRTMPWFYATAVYLRRHDIAHRACIIPDDQALSYFKRSRRAIVPELREQVDRLEVPSV